MSLREGGRERERGGSERGRERAGERQWHRVSITCPVKASMHIQLARSPREALPGSFQRRGAAHGVELGPGLADDVKGVQVVEEAWPQGRARERNRWGWGKS